MNDIDLMNAEELAAILKVSKWQVYELAKKTTRTGEVRHNPIPSLRLGGVVRFSKSAVESWLANLRQAAKVTIGQEIRS